MIDASLQLELVESVERERKGGRGGGREGG